MIGLQSSLIIFVIAVTIATFLIAVVVLDVVTTNTRNVKKRIGFLWGQKTEKALDNKRKDTKSSGSKKFIMKQSIISKLASAISEELQKSNILMKPEEFAMMWIILTFIPALLALMFLGNVMLPPILALAGAMAPILIVKQKQKKRIGKFDEQLSDALMICSNCLKSGLTFSQAMETIADEMEDPISSEFRRVVNEISYGSSQDGALEAMSDRVKSADFAMVVSAVSVQKQTGGNLSEILEIIANTIRERMKIRGEIKALTAQGRMSGILIGVLPVGLALVLMVINPEYIMKLFTSQTGIMLVIISVILEITGFILINKIVTIKF